ncbi:MAG: TatD family hydrolase [Candidatus Pacebacteria bacterium]|nr:TatD family hydrolase [Candidatus Paceibacterota bacterium]
MKFIDTHAHLNFQDFQGEEESLQEKLSSNEITVINVGIDKFSSGQVVELAQKYENYFAIIGLHPISTVITREDDYILGETFGYEFFKMLILTNKKIVGIGECGFDYVHNPRSSQEVQEKAFRAQIELALEMDLPLMLHLRPSQNTYDAYEEALVILREYKERNPNLRGQAHFFSGTEKIAQEFIELGFYISFTGVITFAPYDELVASIPMNRILSETDSPYAAPVPHRGKRNESSYVVEVVNKMAEIYQVPIDTMSQQIIQNAKKLYRLG